MVELEERIEQFINRVRISQMGAKEEKFYEKMNKYFSNLINRHFTVFYIIVSNVQHLLHLRTHFKNKELL